MIQSAIHNPIFLLTLTAALSGCGGKASDAELDAAAALKQSGVRVGFTREGRAVRLDFGHAQVSDEQLATAGKCAGLEVLVLQEATFDEDGLAHLAGLSRLARISLKKTAVSDAGLAYLSPLKSLREIDLEETKVSDVGLEHLAGLKKLEKLYLDGTLTTPAGVGKLKAALPNLKVYGK